MIQMLADTTFGGDYNSAHTFADTGGDILRTGEYESKFYVDWFVSLLIFLIVYKSNKHTMLVTLASHNNTNVSIF